MVAASTMVRAEVKFWQEIVLKNLMARWNIVPV